jgi:hypothetical protein
VNTQVAKFHVPPQVLLPTPPTITDPYARQLLIELHTQLQLPEPMKEAIPPAVL